MDQPRIKVTWIGYASALAAASLFATSGTLIKHLVLTYHIPPMTVGSLRMLFAFGLYLLILGLFNRSSLHIEKRDLPFFLLFGLISVTLMQTCWVYAVSLINVGVATVLNYTAPAWAMVLAWRVLGESMDRWKSTALLITIAGVAMLARVYDAAQFKVDLVGLLWGLGSGITYGLYAIFGKRALGKYNSWTTVTYTVGAGAFFLLLTQSPQAISFAVSSPGALFWLLILALVPTVIGYACYTYGLRYLEAGVIGIVATIEPLIAAVLAAVVLKETLAPPQIGGAALVIAGIILIQVREMRASKREEVSHP